MLTIRVIVKPTEEIFILESSLQSIFPNIELELKDGYLIGSVDDHTDLSKMIREQSIRDTARNHMLGNIHDGICMFELSKDAATVGRINFATGMCPALGTIEITLHGDNVEDMIERITGGE